MVTNNAKFMVINNAKLPLLTMLHYRRTLTLVNYRYSQC